VGAPSPATELQGLGTRIEGKVRDSYVRGDRRTLVATDRISAFDVVLGTIPFKGQVLNQLAAFWFERTREVAPNHVVAVPDPNVTIGRECRGLPLAVRGGAASSPASPAPRSGRPTRAASAPIAAQRLPEGLRKHERLPRPLLTPPPRRSTARTTS